MKKVKFKKRVLKTIGWSLTMFCFILLISFAEKSQNNREALGLRINIKGDNHNYFIESSDIKNLLNARGRKLKGKPMHDINIPMLEKIIYTNAYVDRAEVYSTIDGYVNIDVWQRNPLIRIINSDNEHYYIDEKGEFMPVTNKFSKSVVVANGYIFDHFSQNNLAFASPMPGEDNEKPILHQLYEIALFMENNEFWNSQIEQIYVNENFELELIPRVGNHKVLIGNSDDIELKLENLMIFYREGATRQGWNSYSEINLKYSGQVVCKKSN